MNITQVMNEERQRLNHQLEEFAMQKQAIDAQIKQVKLELNAIDAYEQAKQGKQSSDKSTGERRRGISKGVLDLIQATPQGIRRRDILEKFQAKGNKAKEQSITNALSKLKASNLIRLENGVYTINLISEK
jgi:hypothetical protein